MARKAEEKVFFNIGKEWEVRNVRKLDFGTFFTLALPGLQLYNLRVVPAGRKYDAFIAVPEEKGKDGNYYKLIGLFLSPQDTEAVIAEVEKALKKASK